MNGFIPTSYSVNIGDEDGVYEISAHVCNATTYNVTLKVHDNPVATLIFYVMEGTFTEKDSRIRTLTGGMGNTVRQWHAYPNILPKELYSDEIIDGEKYVTL